jgi:hypothetical protein
MQGQDNNGEARRDAGDQTGDHDASTAFRGMSLDQRRDVHIPAGGKALFGQCFLYEGQHPSVVAQVPPSRQVRRDIGYSSILIGILPSLIALNVAYKGKYEEKCDKTGPHGMPVHPFRAI